MSSILHTNFPAPILFRIVARKTAKLALFFWAVGGLLAVHANSKEFSDDVPQTDEIVVTGKVTDENGEGLPGATVTVKNTSLGTITDVEGNFSLEVPEDAVLVFSFVGYVSQEVVLKGQSVINTSLSPDLTSLDEVVVIGYGETKTRDLTGAVSIVDPDDLGQQPVSNIGDAIQGRAAGVSVTTSGQPGSNPTFRIRGIGTINNNDPFIVVDGMPLNGGLNQINMNDIESVQVLKDASATTIYGARGANGVVLITTKRGKKGKASVTFDAYTGITEATNMLDVLNAREFAQLSNEMLTNGGLDPNPDFNDPESLGNGTDWLGAFFDRGKINSYALSYSNGNDKSKVYTSLNYFDQQGIILNTDYKRFNFQLNTDTEVTKNLKFGNSLKLNHDIKEQGDFNIQNAILSLPTQPIRREDGDFSGAIGQPLYSGDVDNPIGKATIVDMSTRGYNAQGSLFGEITFLKYLTFKSLGGIEVNIWKNRTWTPSYEWDSDIAQNAYLYEAANQSITLLWDNTLTYQQSLDNGLNLTALIGSSAQQNDFEFISGSIQDFQSEETQTLNNGIAQMNLDGSGSEWALFSYFVRFNVDFESKYYLTGTVRRDGSSRFGEGNKYGTFPSGSAAWRISQEDFFDVAFIEDLKIRGGYGITGNQEIGNYSFASSYDTYRYNFNNTFVSAVVPTVLPNTNVRWESQEQINVGLDLSMFKGRVNATIDGYIKNTKDMLVPQAVPVTSGYSDIYVPSINAGQMRNRGIEVVVNTTNIQNEKLIWTSDVVFSFNHNEVIDINSETPLTRGGIGLNYNLARIQPGYPVNVFYGFVTEGIFQTDEEVQLSAVQIPGSSSATSTSAGDIRFQDLNNDGIINDDDRTFLGNPNPDFIYSLNNTFSYGNFSLNIFLQGVQGRDIFNANRIYTEGMSITTNQNASVIDRWTGPGSSNTIPRAIYGDPNNNARPSSRYIEDGSYLRVKNITLAYNIPSEVIGKGSFGGAKVYVSGQNLFTLTNYSGLDPEVGVDGIDNNLYPVTRTVSIGLNVKF
ncbi:SusC/RagA family TonB-linked outer membrane protein [Marinoscillum luteum]|uniref:SusC/RagA family TonB-linked outer membrane protein n=1 Tax=Marinoscillum luteum TaxID=861051 RepID=A0ABW7NBU9_9BACT